MCAGSLRLPWEQTPGTHVAADPSPATLVAGTSLSPRSDGRGRDRGLETHTHLGGLPSTGHWSEAQTAKAGRGHGSHRPRETDSLRHPLPCPLCSLLQASSLRHLQLEVPHRPCRPLGRPCSHRLCRWPPWFQPSLLEYVHQKGLPAQDPSGAQETPKPRTLVALRRPPAHDPSSAWEAPSPGP